MEAAPADGETALVGWQADRRGGRAGDRGSEVVTPVRLGGADAEELQRRVAGSLCALGLRAGDRVLVAVPPSTAVVVLALAAMRTGIVPVLVDPAMVATERRRVEADADAALVVDGAGAAVELGRGPAVELAPVPLTRAMHYTSGTSGTPKGVWSAPLAEADGAAWVAEETELWGFCATDVHLVCGPLHHSAPLRFAALTLLAAGDVVVPGRFTVDTFVSALAEHRVSTTFVVPAHLQRLLGPGGPGAPGAPGFDTSTLRLVAHAGAPCPEPLKRRAIEAFGEAVLWEFYGATEGQCTVCSAEEWLERPGTVGRARLGRSITADPDGTLWCEVPGHARFSYWRDPVATAAAWRGGAFSVGDVGRLDPEGYLFLEGRRGEVIITGGVNVAPLEVERALSSCPGIDDVVVYGVADERWGQRVCAAVVGSATPDAVRAHARVVLSAAKRPKDVVVVDVIPRSATGKVRRHAIAGDLTGPGER